MEAIGTVLLAMLAGGLRVSTPFLFVSLGECLTEKSGRINLGNEGVLVLGAMVAYATSYETGSPWAGVAAAAGAGLVLGGVHGAICSLARVNDVAMGIAIIRSPPRRSRRTDLAGSAARRTSSRSRVFSPR